MFPSRLLVSASLAVAALASSAHALVFTATLSGANESPAVVSPGTGTTTVTYDPVAHTLRVEASFSGLSGLTTAAHIHVPVVAGTNGPVATQTPSFAGFPLGVSAGSFDSTFDLTMSTSFNAAFITSNGGTVAGAEAALAAALQSNRAYLNIHTNLFLGGEIRGNLAARVPDGGYAAGLFLPALLGLVAVARRTGLRRSFSTIRRGAI